MSQPRVRRLLLPLALLVPFAGNAMALQEPQGDSWTWRVAPYLWTTGIDGTLTTPIGTAEFEVDFGDIWDNLESGALVFVEAQKEQLTILGDVIYLGLEADGETPLGNDADLEMDTTILEMAGLFRLTPESPLELGLGLRYASIESDLELGANSSDGSHDSFDGFAAGRATWPFARRWSLQVYGDVGAGDADLTWQGSAMLGFYFENWGLGFGYRILDYDLDDGAKELDLSFEGLVYGFEFQF